MINKLTLFCLLSAAFLTVACSADQKPIVIVVPSHNNKQWYQRNLDSLRTQRYDSYHVLYLDDGSTDGTADAVAAYIQEWGCDDLITLIKNPKRSGMVYNLYAAVHCCPNNAIIVVVDGDDWLADEEVLTRINSAYQDPEIWMTYGQFQEYPSGKKGFCMAIPEYIRAVGGYRYHDWVSSHLKTFYAGLFKQIPLGHLISNGAFLTAACDVAIMLPMLERAGGRVAYIEEILYIYNTHNAQSVCRTRPLAQIRNNHWVRSRTPLQPMITDPAQADLSKAHNEVYNCHISLISAEACGAYLLSLSATDIDPEKVMVWYRAASADEAAAYKKLGAEYGVICNGIPTDLQFKTTLLHSLLTIPESSGIVVTVDDCRWIRRWSSKDALRMLHKTGALCFAAGRGAIQSSDSLVIESYAQPPLIQLEPALWVWKCSEAFSSWHMPYGVPGNLYRAGDFAAIINSIQGDTAADCVRNLLLLPPSMHDAVVACGTEVACAYFFRDERTKLWPHCRPG